VKYDDLLPVCLHQAKSGEWYLLDRHNDEIARFDPTVEIEDMKRLVRACNQYDELVTKLEEIEKGLHNLADPMALEKERVRKEEKC
jgi:hypothetical protein